MSREWRGIGPLAALLLCLLLGSAVDAKDLIIDRLQAEPDTLDIFCRTGGSIIPDDSTDSYVLTISDEIYSSKNKPSSGVQVFPVDVSSLYGKTNNFKLELKKGDDLKATTSVTFRVEDLSATKAAWVGAETSGQPGNILRLWGKEENIKICPSGEDDTDCLNVEASESYVKSSGLTGDIAFACLPDLYDPSIPFCLVQIDILTSAELYYSGEIRLTYQEDQTAPRYGTLGVEKVNQGRLRDLFYIINGDPDVHVCIGEVLCPMDSFPSQDNQYGVFFVEYEESNSDLTGASLKSHIYDYGLIGTVIGNDMMEMRWTAQQYIEYKVTLTDIDGNEIGRTPSPFSSVNVLCDITDKCFAYFFGLEPMEYRVMVQPKDNRGNTFIYNTIVSSKQVVTSSRKSISAEPLSLVIKKLEVVDFEAGKFSVHFTGTSEKITQGDLTIIKEDQITVEERNYQLTAIENSWANIKLDGEVLNWVQSSAKLQWFLRVVKDDGSVMFGKEAFTFPDMDSFPNCEQAHVVGGRQLVRVQCPPNIDESIYEVSMVEANIEILSNTGVAGVTYHVLNDTPESLNVQICRHPDDNENSFICTHRMLVQNGADKVGDVTAIAVEYNTQVMAVQSPPTDKQLDGLVYYYGANPPTLRHCPAKDTCEMNDYEGGEDVEVTVVYADADKVVGSRQNTVYDLSLSGSLISDTIFEIAINKMAGRDVYHISMENSVDATDAFTTKLMCQDVGPTCYAYFFELTGGATYKSTVAPDKDQNGTGGLDPMNQVISSMKIAQEDPEGKGVSPAAPLTLVRINRVEANGTRFSVDVTVSNEGTKVVGVASVTMLLVSGEEEYEATASDVGDGTIGTEAIFHFDINPTDTVLSPSTKVVLFAKDENGGLLAEAEADLQLQSIDPELTWVGGPDTSLLRVSTKNKLEINGIECESTCFIMDFDDSEGLEVCVNLNDNASPGSNVKQCDLTRTTENANNMTDENIALNYEENKYSMTVSKASTGGLEVVLFTDEKNTILENMFACDEETCSEDVTGLMADLGPEFNVLVVGLDESNAVANAVLVPFEDFQIRVQRFSDDGDIEVRWGAAKDQSFIVQLDKAVDDGFTKTNTQCGGLLYQRRCKAYFTKLNGDTDYKVKIEKENKVVSASVPSNAGPFSSLTISKMSKAVSEMHITVKTESDITGIKHVEYVVIEPPVDGTAEQNITFRSFSDMATGETIIPFKNLELPAAGQEVTVLVVVHDSNDVDSDALAAGKAVLTFEDISPTLTWVGGTGIAPLRVFTDLTLLINEDYECDGRCYLLDFDNSNTPPELCVSLDTAVGTHVQQCDLTQIIDNAAEMVIDEIELNYNEDQENKMIISADSPLMEVVLYKTGDTDNVEPTFTCSDNPCKSDNIKGVIEGTGSQFYVLVVGLVNVNTVTSSSLVDFEDFQTRVQRLSDVGDIEVRWRSSVSQTFNVHLEKPVDGGFTDTTVECGGDSGNRECKCYFTKLDGGSDYTVEIEKDNKVVSAVVPNTIASVTHLTIGQFMETASELQLTVSAGTTVPNVLYVEYVVIEPLSENATKQQIIFTDFTGDISMEGTIIGFEDGAMPDADTQVSILVVVHSSQDEALAAGKAELIFKDIKTSLTWVGGNNKPPLRVDTNQMLQINGANECDSKTCYFLDFEAPSTPLELCVALEENESGDTIKQCDSTQKIENTNAMDVDRIELNYNAEEKHIMTVSSADSESLEVVLYQDKAKGNVSETFSCDGGECDADVTDDVTNIEFNVLIVGLTSSKTVENATVVPFEDLQMRVQRFSEAGDIEVRWRSFTEMEFNIILNNTVQDGFHETNVVCGSFLVKECKAYFTKLNDDVTYNVEVAIENKVVSATVPTNIVDFAPLNITRISKAASSMTLTVSTPKQITSISYVEYVVIEDYMNGVANQDIIFFDFDDDIHIGEETFRIDAQMPDAGKEFSVLVVIHASPSDTLDALAAGKALLDFKELSPSITWVGEQETTALRVTAEMALEVNRTACGSTTCYLLGFENSGPLEVCVVLENMAFPGDEVRQCDLTQTAKNANAMDIDMIELNYNSERKHIMTVTSAATALEVVLYKINATENVPESFSCESGSCSRNVTEQMPDLGTEFLVLVVGIDDSNDVANSTVVPFEDFQIRVQRFNDIGDMEVRWRASDDHLFNIQLVDKDKVESINRDVQCGGSDTENRKCKAYFTTATENGMYDVQIQNGNKLVSASVPPTPGISTVLSITQISQVSDIETMLKFSPENLVTDVKFIEFVIITDHQEITFEDYSANITEDTEVVFEDVVIPSLEATIFVVAHGDDSVDADALAAGKAVVTFEEISPSLTWVGGTDAPPLRVKTDLLLEINGVDQCDSKTCYFLHFGYAPSLEACVVLTNTANGDTVKQCDSSLVIENTDVMSDERIELNYDEEQNHWLDVSSVSNKGGLEVVLYKDEDTEPSGDTLTCDQAACSSNVSGQMTDLGTEFNVLIVGLDELKAVANAALVPFEDFQIRVQRYSAAGDIEVWWRSSYSTSFNIELDQPVAEGFTKTNVQCGGSDASGNRGCKAYFTKLDDAVNYKTEINVDNKVVSASVPKDPENISLLTFQRITKISTPPLSAELNISANENITGIDYVEYVVVKADGDTSLQTIVFLDANDDICAGDNTLIFPEIESPPTGEPVSVLVVVHGAGEEESAALAAGKAVVTFEVLVLPKMTKVGSDSFLSLRVETSDQDITVNGESCSASTVCHFTEFQSLGDSPVVCRSMSDDVEQCDETGQYLESNTLSDPVVDLLFIANGEPEALSVTTSFDDSSKTMDVVIYDDEEIDETSCNIEDNTCVSSFGTASKIFKLLLVALDDDSNVVESNTIEFEDFQVRFEQLTGDAAEVKWSTSTTANFTIRISPSPNGGFNKTRVQCDKDDNCVAYFIALAVGETYTASVNIEGDMTTTVSARVIMEPVLTTLHLTQLKLRKALDKSTDLTACFEDELLSTGKTHETPLYDLAVIDSYGKQVHLSSNLSSDSTKVVGEVCLGPLALDRDLNTNEKIHVLVNRAGNETRSGTALQVYLLDPRPSLEVLPAEPKTLTAKWRNLNLAPSFEVRAGGVGRSVICGAGVEDVECLQHLNVVAEEKAPLAFTLREVGLEVNQEVEVALRQEELSGSSASNSLLVVAIAMAGIIGIALVVAVASIIMKRRGRGKEAAENLHVEEAVASPEVNSVRGASSERVIPLSVLNLQQNR